MLHMTLEADYAVRIVELLAASQKTDAHTISEMTQVPLRFALKILRKLVGSGLVQSYKGAKGGYQVTRDPSSITLREVIESVEGPIYAQPLPAGGILLQSPFLPVLPCVCGDLPDGTGEAGYIYLCFP